MKTFKIIIIAILFGTSSLFAMQQKTKKIVQQEIPNIKKITPAVKIKNKPLIENSKSLKSDHKQSESLVLKEQHKKMLKIIEKKPVSENNEIQNKVVNSNTIQLNKINEDEFDKLKLKLKEFQNEAAKFYSYYLRPKIARKE